MLIGGQGEEGKENENLLRQSGIVRILTIWSTSSQKKHWIQ